MKKRLLCFLSVCFFALPCSSCSNNNSFRESEPLSDKELGLTDFDMSVPTLDNYSSSWDYLRTGGSYDPLPQIKDKLDTVWETGALAIYPYTFSFDYYWTELFSSSSFKIFDFNDLIDDSRSLRYFPTPDAIYNEKTASFSIKFINTFDHNYDDTNFFRYSLLASAVYSGNSFSYILNPHGFTIDVVTENYLALLTGHNVLRIIRYDDEFPYRVYFDKYYIYFMSKNADFSLDYLKEFNARADMHLFKL
jgi:hypothetical protein